MIPEFPEFKRLELKDRSEIEEISREFPPYSDFNFTSMWIWNVNGTMKLSKLNGNLVVQFSDYITGEPFLSFLGASKIEETAQTLLDFSKKQGFLSTLKLVPEQVAGAISTALLVVEEDRDNFDYVYACKDLHALEGSKFQQARYRAKRFLKENPTVTARIINLEDPVIEKAIFDLIKIWESNKISKSLNVELEHEETALKRLFQNLKTFNLLSLGVFLGESLISFSILEVLPGGYAISHFHKADNNYLGIYDFLMQEKARHFVSINIDFFNYEQDLGLPSLRRSKSSFRPTHFLKKYLISSKI